MSDRHEMQAAGTHPAPCARHCEATAYEVEIRRLRSEVTRLSSMVDHQRDEAIETERMLRAELAHYKDAAKMMAVQPSCMTCTAPAPAEVPMPDVFMYGVKEPDGGAWMQEVCVSTLKGDVDELVDDLNEGRDDADTRYTSVSLVTTEDAKRYGDAREAAGYAHAVKVIKRLRDSHQTDTGECQSDCDFVTAWDSAIAALRGEEKP